MNRRLHTLLGIALTVTFACSEDPEDSMDSFGSGLDSADDGGEGVDDGGDDGGDGDGADADGGDGDGEDDGDGDGGAPSGDCGNGEVDGDEQCDGEDFEWMSCQSWGYEAGVLGCNSDCTVSVDECILEAVCGDDVIAGLEDCEGAVEDSCEGLGLGTGTLACGSDCRFDAAGCSCKGVDESCSVNYIDPTDPGGCCPIGFKGIERGICGTGSGKCL